MKKRHFKTIALLIVLAINLLAFAKVANAGDNTIVPVFKTGA